MVGQGLKLHKEKEWAPLQIAWQPQWYISYCGQKGSTSECVGQVKTLLDENPEYGRRIDRQMEIAVDRLEEALKVKGERSQQALYDGVNQAKECFEKWGLVSPALKEHCDMLSENGAKAWKPTGSGGGGYVLSVWDKEPPEKLKNMLISLQRPERLL